MSAGKESMSQLVVETVATLTTVEAQELAQHERVIERGLETFYEVGASLMAIRDKRLYRAEFGTFEAYCEQRWSMERRQAYRLMDAAAAVKNVSHGTQTIVPANERQARPLTQLQPEEQPIVWQRVVETAPEGKITASHVTKVVEEFKRPEVHQFINQSISNEWYTPKVYLDAVREVLGEIDLDPASCELANRTVGAKRIYTIDDDGFALNWFGRVFLNPPYGRDEDGSNQAKWSARLIDQYKAGNVSEAIMLVNAVTGERWFAKLWDYTLCFTDHRIKFYNADGEYSQPTHSNVFVYLGNDPLKFARVFQQFGVIAQRMEVGG